MRTTAVYGSGKFGAADRELLQQREEFTGSFQVEMLCVWLIRAFTLDMVEEMAKFKGGSNAVKMQPELRRCIGVGNSTGLGMAPFLVNHPLLLNNWICAREQALARVRSLETAERNKVDSLKQFVVRAHLNTGFWRSKHEMQIEKIKSLLDDFEQLIKALDDFDWQLPKPWNRLYLWSEKNLSLEGQEQLSMLLLEPYPELVDELAQQLCADESNIKLIEGNDTVSNLTAQIEKYYDWAISIDHSDKNNYSRFWYVSEEKLEPRLGERFDEPGAELEQPLCIAWHVSQLYEALKSTQKQKTIAEFLRTNPQYRHSVRRVQQIEDNPYMEIRDNLIASNTLPIDMLRLKLSFFGAMKFDPRSDRWVRINMFQYAPFPDELHDIPEDEWAYPPLVNSTT